MGDLSRFELTPNSANRIIFVMIDGSGSEVTGLDGALTVEISKNGAALGASGGTQGEIGKGLYWYLTTAAETDTVGPVGIVVNGAGAIQQNLEYVVSSRVQNSKQYQYPVTENDLVTPISGALVEIFTGANRVGWVWTGTTDGFGIARDEFDNLPILVIGQQYYFWTQKIGYTFPNPDVETIS